MSLKKYQNEIKDIILQHFSQGKPVSSLGINYPFYRDHPLHSGHLWLESKRLDDGAEGLWRVHDGLYDLNEFIEQHPGGAEWLKLTQGTDITEAFEAHHLSEAAHELLPKFYVREAKTPRNSPFTFKENDFYCTLRKKVNEELKSIPEKAADRSKLLIDLMLFTYLSTSLLAVYFRSYFIGIIAGISLSLTAVAAHNFFHQKDNFRMHYFDLTMMSYREWRISHVLSHHLYTNTINDLEISALEPFLQYLPTPKTFFFKYLSWFYSPIVYAFLFIGYYIRSIIQTLNTKRKIPLEMFVPLLVPILLWYLTKESVLTCLVMYLFIQIVGSIHFGLVGVNAAHHHPDIFHDGDKPRPKEEFDWGVFQLDAVMDRKDITGSHFLVLTNFGDHALHHLFPTIDHGKLEYLYPTFIKTCKEFGLEWRLTSQLELAKGQFRQLSKTEPKQTPPKPVISVDR